MDGPTPALPPNFAVRAYLRQHPMNDGDCFPAIVRQFGTDCNEAYSSRGASAQQLYDLAEAFVRRATSVTPFAVFESHRPGSKALRAREKRGVSAFFMEPISLAQVNRTTGEAYEEQAVLLRTLQAEFRLKRATFGFGTGTLVLTQHLLERIYGRTDVHHEDFEKLLHSEFADLLRGIALSTVGALWLDSRDEHGIFRVGEVPYSHGLIKVEARTLIGDAENGVLGCWIGMHGREGRPFVNPMSRIEGTVLPAQPELIAIEAACGVTYLNITQLRPEQLEYYYTFEALKEELGTTTLDSLADYYCAPHFPNERPPDVSISDRADMLLKKVRSLLSSQALKPSRSLGVCFISPSAYSRAPRRRT